MNQPKVTELFHYYKKIEYAKDTISEQKVYCSHPNKFNDPFDGVIPVKSDIDTPAYIANACRCFLNDKKSWVEIKSALDNCISPNGNLKRDVKLRIEKETIELKNKYYNSGVLCLSENALSILMWSHYANNHKGICIGFKRSKTSNLGIEDACMPIEYSDAYPNPKLSQTIYEAGSFSKNIMFTKAREWAYEKEWRLLTIEASKKVCIPGKISKVILGCKFNKNLINSIAVLCKEKSIPLYKVIIIPGKFALKLEQIDS